MTELQCRVNELEKKLAQVAKRVDLPVPADLNSWIDLIHATFTDDAGYRKAARFGRRWRESERPKSGPRPRKAGKK